MSPMKPQTSAALQNAFDDLCMRFLVNLPESEYASFERLFFAVESAHWFYDDFFREANPELPRLPLKHFAARMFANTALLSHYRDDAARLTAQFQLYKQEVPTCGAAILTPCMNKVLLVRAWGSNARWGFPKGKLSKDETELEAATREVLEEVGYDISPHVNENTPYVDTMSSGRYSRIFIVTGVPESTEFETQTRKEISDIKWVPLDALPESPKAAKVMQGVMLTSTGKHHRQSGLRNIFFSQYGVPQHAKRIRAWVKRHRKTMDAVRGIAGNDEISVGDADKCAIAHDLGGSVGTSVVDTAALMQNAISLEDLEASFVPSKPVAEPGRGVPAESGRSHKDGNNAGASVAPNSGRKSKKEGVQREDTRNRTTFGADSGFRLNESEREKLFRQYVVETDRIAAEKGLADDSWPVPIVTSKDFSEEQIREAQQSASRKLTIAPAFESAAASVNRHPPDPSHLPAAGMSNHAVPTRERANVMMPCVEAKDDAFIFDRAAIMKSMNATIS